MRETLLGLQELDLAWQGQRLGVVMRRLSAFAALFALAAAITGHYGMNVTRWPPAESASGGYVAAGLILGSLSLTAVVFHRRNWL